MKTPQLLFAMAFCFLAGFLLLGGRSERQMASEMNERNGRSGALQALSFWSRARAYPNADIPPDKFYKAVLHKQAAMQKYARATGSTSSWQSIGPTNLSGRMISVAVNPMNSNTLYAGSASGGLWRSHSDGVNGDWERVNTGFPVLGVGAIAIQPNDSNTIYIGTGEVYQYQTALGGLIVRTTRGSYGIGILKTTDGGKTWSKSLDWTMENQTGVQCLTFNPLNYNTILAATTEGIFKSTDAGTSWYQTLGVAMAENILINPQDTGLALASVGNFDSFLTGLYYSFDTGDNWIGASSSPASNGKTMLEMYQNNPNIIFASIAESTTSVSSLWRSTDFGFTWGKVSSFDVAGVQGWYSHYVAVHPLDSSQVIRGGVSIYKSVTGGRTQYSGSGSYSDHHAYAHDPNNPDIIYDANDDGIYRSTDFGDTYTYVSDNLVTGQFYNGFSNSSQDSTIAIGQVQDHIPGYLYRGSPLWWRSVTDECGWTTTNPLNDQYAFAVDRNGGNIYRSTNRGFNFSFVYGNPEFGAWNTPILLSPSNPSVVYEARNLVYKTTDNGQTWLPTSNSINDGNVALSMAISATSPDTVYVGKAPYSGSAPAKIYRSINGGGLWTDISHGLPNQYPLDLAVDPKNSLVVYAGFGGFGIDHLFKSTNGGGSWSDISTGLPDIPVTAVAIDPQNSNYVYVGTDVGAAVSTNGGASWNDFSEGLPDAVLVSDIVVSPSNRSLRLVTHGNGVYERAMPALLPYLTLTVPTGGETWDALTDTVIRWDEAAAGLVRIEYSTDNGGSWSLIADSVNGAARSYVWQIPLIQTASARIRVTSLLNSGITSQSGSAFSIKFRGGFVTLATGWNLISLPSMPANRAASALFPTAASPLFEYIPGSGYSTVAGPMLVDSGKGYWVRYGGAVNIPMPGDSILSLQIPLQSGWNMVGTLSVPVPRSAFVTTPPGILSPSIFSYNGGYVIADTIYPGEGYWVRSSSAGTLSLSASGAQTLTTLSPPPAGEAPNTMEFRDASGRHFSLKFSVGQHPAGSADFELPPTPPRGEFDVRFADQSFAVFAGRATGPSEFPVQLQGVRYPLVIHLSMTQSAGWTFVTAHGEAALSDNQDVTLRTPEEKLALRYDPTSSRPLNYALHQNYPNPFNPSTTITFDLPVASHVTITIYSTLGEEVAKLDDGIAEAGTHTTLWDASQLPSGVYILRLQAASYNASRKMLLVK